MLSTRAEVPKAHEQITDLSSAVGYTASNSNGAVLYLIEPENYAIRFRDDGTNPTSTTGIRLAENTIFEYTACNGNLKFITDQETDAGFAISSNFDVANANAIGYKAAGVSVTLSASTVADTGTSKTIAADQWAGMLISGSSGGTLTGTWTADAASEAAAITLVKALTVPQGEVPLGYITVQTAASNTWTAGTDALQGGTGGNPSADTNYYNYRGAKVNIAFYGTTSTT